jgi:hypothetical protein
LTFLIPVIILILSISFYVYYIEGNRISNNYLNGLHIPAKEESLTKAIINYFGCISRSPVDAKDKRVSGGEYITYDKTNDDYRKASPDSGPINDFQEEYGDEYSEGHNEKPQ